MLLPVTPFRQTEAFCGPASLKMVLDFYGIDKTEQALAELAGTTFAQGTSGEGLVKAAQSLGLKAWLKDEASLEEIRELTQKKGIPPIIDWFPGEVGHYSVVTGLDDKNIHFIDPSSGPTTMDLIAFQGVWFDFYGEFPRSKADMIVRRIIVVEPPTR